MASRQQGLSKASPYLRGACVASRLAPDHPDAVGALVIMDAKPVERVISADPCAFRAG